MDIVKILTVPIKQRKLLLMGELRSLIAEPVVTLPDVLATQT